MVAITNVLIQWTVTVWIRNYLICRRLGIRHKIRQRWPFPTLPCCRNPAPLALLTKSSRRQDFDQYETPRSPFFVLTYFKGSVLALIWDSGSDNSKPILSMKSLQCVLVSFRNKLMLFCLIRLFEAIYKYMFSLKTDWKSLFSCTVQYIYYRHTPDSFFFRFRSSGLFF